jgi:peptide/nickel transport system substrate-binding protein
MLGTVPTRSSNVREESMTNSGMIGRRTFLGATAALSLATIVTGRVGATEPKRGGNFRIGVADFATSDDLDPANINTRFQTYLQYQLRNYLVEVGPGGKLIPELAESWEGTNAGKTWTFKLRGGVSFHNGKPMTAQDVIFSFNYHTKPNSKSTGKPMLSSLTGIKADGDHTVIFDLSAANVSFPAVVSNYSFVIVPDGTTNFDQGMGTGGYILEEFRPGVSSRVTRNPDYWKSGRAHFDSVEMLTIKDSTARIGALLSDRIDAFNFVDPNVVSMLEQNKGIRIQRVASKAHYVFPMLVDTDPLKDTDVRNAMKYAIDREDVLKRLLRGLGSVGNDHPFNAAYPFYDATIEQRAYDPDKARYLLKKADKTDLAVQLFVSETPFVGATDAAVLFQQHAAKAGIKIEVVKTPENGYWDDIWDKKPFCASRWSGRITEDSMLSLAYTDEGIKVGWNETHLNNEQLNKLVLEARSEFDDGKRKEMYSECQQIIRDDGGSVIFAFADFVDAVSVKVANDGHLSSEWDLDGGRAAERWWFV